MTSQKNRILNADFNQIDPDTLAILETAPSDLFILLQSLLNYRQLLILIEHFERGLLEGKKYIISEAYPVLPYDKQIATFQPTESAFRLTRETTIPKIIQIKKLKLNNNSMMAYIALDPLNLSFLTDRVYKLLNYIQSIEDARVRSALMRFLISVSNFNKSDYRQLTNRLLFLANLSLTSGEFTKYSNNKERLYFLKKASEILKLGGGELLALWVELVSPEVTEPTTSVRFYQIPLEILESIYTVNAEAFTNFCQLLPELLNHIIEFIYAVNLAPHTDPPNLDDLDQYYTYNSNAVDLVRSLTKIMEIQKNYQVEG